MIPEEYFTIYRWKLNGKNVTSLNKYYPLMSVIQGAGKIIVEGKGFDLKKGDSFIMMPTVSKYELYGTVEIIVSHT